MIELLATQIKSTEEDKKSKGYLASVHGKATDNLANMVGSEIVENKKNNTGILDDGEVKLVVGEYDKLSGKLGVSTHKLLSTAVASFTEQNHVGHSSRKLSYTAINIPLKDYAICCGYDVEPRPTETPEEAEKEKKRADNALKNARRKINKDLELLFSSTLSWKESVKGKQGDYLDVRLVEAKGIKNGLITIRFSQTFSEYLVQLPLTQYPIALLGVDERNNNAYTMGLKIAEHYNIDNNQIIGSAQRLKVSTLLKVTTLPDCNSPSVKKHGWENRIKDPLEVSLEVLVESGFLKSWEYCKPKGEAMTDEEATNFPTFKDWADTLIQFTLESPPDHTPRLEARAEERKRNEAKKKAKKK